MSTPAIPIAFLRAATHHAAHRGVMLPALLARYRIPARLLQEDDAWIAVTQYADVIVALMQQMQDESLGHLPGGIPLGSYQMMGHATITSATVGECLQRCSHFFGLVNTTVEATISNDARYCAITLPHDVAEQSFFYESWFFCLHRYLSWFAGQRLPIHAVHLPQGMTGSLDSVAKLFPGAVVKTHTDTAALLLPVAVTELPGQRTPEQLQRFMRHPLLTMLTERQSDGWSAKVRSVLRGSIDNMPELTAVASILDVHPQTLRRRLANEGTSFTELKVSIRRDVALHYLAKPGHSIEEVAYRAGFSEASAFTRAFKGWTGVTPYAYRKGLN